jgi:hypothetical protein
MTKPAFDRPAYLAAKAAKLPTQAAAALEAGFASEAGRKQALADLNRAYEALRDIERDKLLPGLWNAEGTERDETVMTLLDAIPFDLHQFRAKATEALASRPAFIAEVQALAALRAEIKAAPVEPRPPREDHPLLRAARADIEAIQAKRLGDYQDALDLGRRFKGLPVNVHRVFCGNYAGTRWVRMDWFLSGNKVAFNIIAAAYDKLVREGTIVEEAK